MIFDGFSANQRGFVGGFLRVTPILRRNSYRNSLNVYIFVVLTKIRDKQYKIRLIYNIILIRIIHNTESSEP